jgi:nucleoside 2-deoxyribosyltransferase
MVRIFLATKIPKGEDAKKVTNISEDIITEIKSLKNVEIIKGENRDLDESNFLLIFGHDCRHIKNSDIVIVDAREKIGAGTAQEMLIAKYFKKPVITVLPKNTHHRRTNFEINGKIVEDWIHPFIHSTSDTIVEDYKDLLRWIKKYGEDRLKVKDMRIVDKAIEYYECITK